MVNARLLLGEFRLDLFKNVPSVLPRHVSFIILDMFRTRTLTRSDGGSALWSNVLTGRQRFDLVSLELTGQRRLVSPCWLSQAHPIHTNTRESFHQSLLHFSPGRHNYSKCLPRGFLGKCCQPAACSEGAMPSSSHTDLQTHISFIFIEQNAVTLGEQDPKMLRGSMVDLKDSLSSSKKENKNKTKN